MLKLEFNKHSLKFIDKLSARDQKQVFNKLDQLLENPLLLGSIQLKGNIYCYRRIQVGNKIRLIYLVENDTLVVIAIGYRGDIYKNIPSQDFSESD